MLNLNQRQKQIIFMLANSLENEIITMKSIAKSLNLSTRTIIRDFKIIEKWFLENDFKFMTKSGVGLILNEDKDTKIYLIELINYNYKVYSKLERKIIILSNLLTTTDPIKSNYFLKILNISKTIINDDFDSISNYLIDFDIKFIRKKGVGCYILGKEEKLRNCFISLVYEYYKEQDIIDILRNIEYKINSKYTISDNIINSIVKLVDVSFFANIFNIVNNNIKKFNLILSDDAYIEFIFLILISVKRITLNQNVSFNFSVLKELENTKKFDIVKKICLDLERSFDIKISVHEICFITNHFKSLRQITKFENIDDIKILNATRELIHFVEKELNVYLLKDNNFFNDLLNHFDYSIHRMKLGMKIKNPFLEDIKEEYFDIYTIVMKNIFFIKDAFDISFIPEEEIAYITMHFIVAYERYLFENTEINVVISCHTGVGTSKILMKNLKQKFQNINVIKILPSVKLNDVYLRKNNVDLVISTVDASTTLPFVKINPIVDYDIEKKLKKIILSLSKQKINNQKENMCFLSLNKDDDIFDILNISKYISSILKDFKFIKEINILSIEELIKFTTNLFSNDILVQNSLYEDLINRLNLSLPYFEDLDLLLLHCNAKDIIDIKLSVITLKNRIIFKSKKIKYVLVMIIPKNSNNFQIELLSEISFNLENNEDFLNSIKILEQESVFKHLKNIMINFYIRKLTQ